MADWPYTTATWARLRTEALAREPLCAVCLRKGRAVPATQVDHVIPINQGGDPFPPLAGLECLCAGCHSRKTKRGDSGRYADPHALAVDPETGMPRNTEHWWHK